MNSLVITYDEAARRAGVVRRTLERMIALGEGPAIIELSARRRGILESDFEAWLLARRRPAPGSETNAAENRRPGRPRKVS